jgi:hypothetical protein
VAPRKGPLVAVVSYVPLLAEALSASLEGVAEVRWFPAGRGDTLGLLRSVRPAAVVVDSAAEARKAETFAREAHALVLHILLRRHRVRVLRNGAWENSGEEPAADAMRNLIIGGLYGGANGERD